MRTNRILAAVALIVLIGALVYGLILAYTPKPQLLQGQIEAREYNVSSKVPGRVEEVLVRRGDKVSEGDLLYAIYSPELKAKLMQAEGGRDAALAMQQEADNGARKQQVAASKEQWLKAQAAAKLARTTFDRVEVLFNEGVLARQKRDEAFTQWQAAKYTEQAALAMYQMTDEGARVETKAAAAGNARMAEGAVNEVSAILADSQMRSPKTGEISEVLLQAGELAPSGFPVVSLIDMSDAWAVFQVREDQLKKFKQGDLLKLKIPALDREVEFTVSHISVMGDFATWRATESGHDFDMRTFEVELRPNETIADLRVGMSVLFTL
ncbi:MULTISPECIES: HlyD family secretion protein [unclassified Shewanella]|uniref:HlyD family secretion protein n=1 Tax=unclassified Shewanella TaxID=196818 RepID=UPI001BBCC5EA|nr:MULTISPECIES: efflux RND transporter periplasmic adaptor subunit [unclassified Shewanella]MCG9730278.1 efflux RND transporter periplasmic adaptor subunit [Shewanella sp. Isolate13]GIU12265.1 membrane protein [Shewanella sp. MBTL60-007]